MTDSDVVHESAVSDFRHGLLNHPDVIERLLMLADLRDHWNADRSPWVLRDYWALIGLTEQQLDGHFPQPTLDYFASIIRERIDLGLWGKLVPVNHGGEYGREQQRVRTVTATTIAGAVDAVARQLNPDRRYPNPPDAPSSGTRRQWRLRLRRLASS
jgi:hypothetical protein